MKKKDIYDRENITLCLINQYWDEKDINHNEPYRLWLDVTVKLNNMPPIL